MAKKNNMSKVKGVNDNSILQYPSRLSKVNLYPPDNDSGREPYIYCVIASTVKVRGNLITKGEIASLRSQ